MNAPWGLESRLKLVVLARRVFDATKVADSYAAIEKQLPSRGNLEPLAVNDFLEYLKKQARAGILARGAGILIGPATEHHCWTS